jgi:ABC-2 type transport system permease protein
MPQQYSQLKAMLAITKASLKATFRSPQSIFFSLFFPVVLIWIFGSLGGGSSVPSVDVAFEKGADSTLPLFQSLKQNPVLNFANPAKKDIEDELRKGRITAVINVQKNKDVQQAHSPFHIHLRTSSASARSVGLLQSVLQTTINQMDSAMYPDRMTTATISQSVVEGRRYRNIDFFLPGMIGFSLIGAAVFGIAFSIYNLRETLVLKRMYSTPIKRHYIILGESLAKVIFQLMTVVVLILFGKYVYDFTLAHGALTFFNMLMLSALALLVFMGFGFFITGIAKNQNVIPVYANLFMFPQYFLSGTFFPKTALPQFLQSIIQFLPLTALNDAMRNVAFEGAPLFSCWPQIVTLVVWGIIVYAATAKVFRWE